MALRTASDLARTLHSSPSSAGAAAAAGIGGSSWPAAPARGGERRNRLEEEEQGLAQVFLFVETFRPTMVEGLSTLPPDPQAVNAATAAAAGAGAGAGSNGAGSGGGGGGGGRLTLALMQERVDVVGVVAALGPWMARWRAQHPDTSTDLLEVPTYDFRATG